VIPEGTPVRIGLVGYGRWSSFCPALADAARGELIRLARPVRHADFHDHDGSSVCSD